MSENNIKLTYIPYSSMDEGFFQSIIEVADSSEYSSMPFILYNSELDINVETLDSVVNRYTEYIDENKVYQRIDDIVKDKDEDDYITIMLYGFNITLDDIRTKIATRIDKNVFILISVLVEDDSCVCTSSIYLPLSIADESEEEWEKHKADADRDLKDMSRICKKLNNLFNDYVNDASATKERYFKLTPPDTNLLEPPKEIQQEPKQKESKESIEDSELDDNFVCYTYEDIDNIVSVVRSGKIFSIEDEDNRVEFNKKALDFIIESLMKFYDK